MVRTNSFRNLKISKIESAYVVLASALFLNEFLNVYEKYKFCYPYENIKLLNRWNVVHVFVN